MRNSKKSEEVEKTGCLNITLLSRNEFQIYFDSPKPENFPHRILDFHFARKFLDT